MTKYTDFIKFKEDFLGCTVRRGAQISIYEDGLESDLVHFIHRNPKDIDRISVDLKYTTPFGTFIHVTGYFETRGNTGDLSITIIPADR